MIEFDLTELAEKSRAKGHSGFMVIDQGGGETPFVGAFLGRDGEPKEQTWKTYSTPIDALLALGK